MSAAPMTQRWETRRLRDAVTKLVDGSHNPPAKQENGQPMLSARNVEQGRIVFDDFRFISNDAFVTENARTRITPGDVLLTIVGTIGRSAVVPEGLGPFSLQRSVAVLAPKSDLLPKFLSYQLQSPRIQRHFESHARGTAQKGVYLKTLGETPLLVPPMGEQRNIVAEIEKQFSRLDEAVAGLKRVKANLKRYKSAILKAAVEGRLVPTEADLARRAGRNYETGAQLLQRILDTRRSQWQGKGTYKEPAAPDTTDLPMLPAEWEWASIDQLAKVGTGATPQRDRTEYYQNGDIPWVTSAVVNQNYVDCATELVTATALAKTNLTIYPAGTLLVAMYGEGKTRGKCAELRISAATNQALAALEAAADVRGYLRLFLEHNYEETRKFASGGVQPNLNLSLVRSIRVPLPPVDEQHRIVAEVDRLLSIAREAEAEVETNLKRAQALKQATLSKAFASSPQIRLSNG